MFGRGTFAILSVERRRIQQRGNFSITLESAGAIHLYRCFNFERVNKMNLKVF